MGFFMVFLFFFFSGPWKSMKINTLFHDHENAINKKWEIDGKLMGFFMVFYGHKKPMVSSKHEKF